MRVCSTYGAGFFYIPGSDTCLRVSGRVRAEYLQMPGLHLTAAQARRLFGLDTAGPEVLDALVRARFLRLSRSGGYVRAESY